jgi:hypothetical protein
MLGARRIFAGVSGSPGSMHALRQAAGLARQHDAVLVPLLARVPPGGNPNERNDLCPERASCGKTRPGSGCGTPATPPAGREYTSARRLVNGNAEAELPAPLVSYASPAPFIFEVAI